MAKSLDCGSKDKGSSPFCLIEPFTTGSRMNVGNFKILKDGIEDQLDSLAELVKENEESLTGEQLHIILLTIYDKTGTRSYFGPDMNQRIRKKYAEESSAPPKD